MKALENIKYPKMTNLERDEDEKQHDQNFQFKLNRNFKAITDAVTEVENSLSRVPSMISEMLPEQVDYIVETGTKNSWKYNKYESGVVEIWRETAATSIHVDTQYGALYYTTYDVNFPTDLFTATPDCVQVTMRTTTDGYFATIHSRNSTLVRICVLGPYELLVSCAFNIYAKGTWK